MPVEKSGALDVRDRTDARGRDLCPLESYVLVVDDEEAVRAFLTRCLIAEGYSVKQAGNATEAFELMMAEPAALVLCDIRLPGRDGLWLAERVHTYWPEVVRRAASNALHTDAAEAPPLEGNAAPRPADNTDAEYTLETPVRCPACGERIDTLKAIRLVRSRVNFMSTLPRRGRVVACPFCLAIVPAELTNF